MAENISIGIIGGSGLYQMEALSDLEEREIQTPFGEPSDRIVIGRLNGYPAAFVPRHGRGHRLMPSEVPYAANIYALKSLGVKHILAISACGSLREDYAPGHLVVPHQLVDFTKGKRRHSFFGDGLVAHVGVADPFCETMRQLAIDSIQTVGGTVHEQGTYITIEGPRFSTRGESKLYRQWGLDIIGMTTSPEAFLAREAEICYAVVAMVTDYDVWHEQEVNVGDVLKTFAANLQLAQNVILEIVPKIATLTQDVPAHTALRGTLTTAPDAIPDRRREELSLLMQSLLG